MSVSSHWRLNLVELVESISEFWAGHSIFSNVIGSDQLRWAVVPCWCSWNQNNQSEALSGCGFSPVPDKLYTDLWWEQNLTSVCPKTSWWLLERPVDSTSYIRSFNILLQSFACLMWSSNFLRQKQSILAKLIEFSWIQRDPLFGLLFPPSCHKQSNAVYPSDPSESGGCICWPTFWCCWWLISHNETTFLISPNFTFSYQQ